MISVTGSSIGVLAVDGGMPSARNSQRASVNSRPEASGPGSEENGSELFNAADNEGRTALMGAAIKGGAEAVRVLLSAGADMNARNKNGLTVLMNSALRGNVGMVRTLIEAGADLNAKDNDKGTALTAAVWGGATRTL